MAVVTRIFKLLLIAMTAAFLGGYFAVILAALLLEGPLAIIGGLFLGLYGAFYAVIVATLPAMILGSVLWALRVHNRATWAATGAATGVGCYLAAALLPGAIGSLVRDFAQPNLSLLAPAFAGAGAAAALFFRAFAELFVDSDEDLGAASA